MGCAEMEDSIEHYACSPEVRGFAASFLRLPYTAAEGLQMLLLVHPALDNAAFLVRAAILTFAVYRVTERRRRDGSPQEARVDHMLQQAAREAVRGHLGATRALDGVWGPAAR